MRLRLPLLIAALAVLMSAWSGRALAITVVHTIDVNTTADETTPGGTTSLREAIDTVNADSTATPYIINLPRGTYNLASELDVSNSTGQVTFAGAGARSTILRASGQHRLTTLGSSAKTAEFGNLTITGGRGTGGQEGGGIIAFRPTNLVRVTLTDNSAGAG